MERTNPELGVGLIGCGGIGQLRAEAIARTPGVRLAAVSDVDERRAADLAGRHHAAVDTDWRAMLRREGVDAVLVSTPPMLHAEMCMQALHAGKHVLCEKPLARTPEEGQAILTAAEQSGTFLGTGFNYRFYPAFQQARVLLDSGIIGELDHVRGYAGYSATDHNPLWVHDAGVVGGGALRDNGIHLIDLTRYFLGEVAEVKGFVSDSVWPFPGCEDNGFALLRSATGKTATLQASWTEWRGYRFAIELYGSRGCIRASCFPMYADVVWSERTGGPTRRKRYPFPFTFVMEHLRSYRWVVVESFVQELGAFNRAVRGASTPVGTGYDGLRAVEIAHQVGQDSASRQPMLRLA